VTTLASVESVHGLLKPAHAFLIRNYGPQIRGSEDYPGFSDSPYGDCRDGSATPYRSMSAERRSCHRSHCV
jgi:hypothetical protein